jgi:hypothetical protein
VSTIAHLSLAEYDRMIEAGVFDERRRRLEFKGMNNPVG